MECSFQVQHGEKCFWEPKVARAFQDGANRFFRSLKWRAGFKLHIAQSVFGGPKWRGANRFFRSPKWRATFKFRMGKTFFGAQSGVQLSSYSWGKAILGAQSGAHLSRRGKSFFSEPKVACSFQVPHGEKCCRETKLARAFQDGASRFFRSPKWRAAFKFARL